MKIYGLAEIDFLEVVAVVSSRSYGGNVIVAEARDLSNSKGGRCQARLRVKLSTGSGSRTSASGRTGPYACWHAYRDVLHEVFTRYPEARVQTGLAEYRGMAGFLADYPATANKNIGSEGQPAYMPDLCNGCDRYSVQYPEWAS